VSIAPGDETAQRIAQLGRGELYSRLRSAFLDEAAQQAPPLALAPEELDRLIEAAAARAGGTLWRRSLAQAATVELGIELREAVWHEAVERAQELAGAPPFAETRPAPEAMLVGDAAPETEEAAPDAEGAGTEAEEAATEAEKAAPDAEEAGTEAEDAGLGLYEVVSPAEEEADDSAAAVEPEPEPPVGESAAEAAEALRVRAVHLGGIESLRGGERDLELRFSEDGMDVLKRSTGAAIGRLHWNEIESVELPRARRGLRGGRRRTQELHVATDRGRASFQLPDLTEEQLRDYLEPMLARARDDRDDAR
jgi:hypothetical protein